MKMRLFFVLLVLTLGLYSSESSAQIFRLQVTNYGAGAGNAAFQSFVDAQILQVQNDINKDLPNAAPDRLMKGMANSSVMAAKGIGTDYASNMDVFLIGAGLGAGADLEKDKNTKSSISGAAVAPGAVIGTNLGFIKTRSILGLDPKRLNVYVNFMSYNYKHSLDDTPGKESSAELKMLSYGMHFRYELIQRKGSKLLGWGGVKATFGYEYNRNDITFNSKINESVNQTSGNGEHITGTITGSPQAIIQTATHSIPLALSTDVQILYILSLYVGAGVDANFGQAKGKGALNANPSTLTCNGGACGGGTSVGVQALANIDATGKVNPWIYRGFGGVQINLPYLRIFAQVDKALGNDLIGATAGVRFAF